MSDVNRMTLRRWAETLLALVSPPIIQRARPVVVRDSTWWGP